jgi:hypothetical protein
MIYWQIACNGFLGEHFENISYIGEEFTQFSW